MKDNFRFFSCMTSAVCIILLCMVVSPDAHGENEDELETIAAKAKAVSEMADQNRDRGTRLARDLLPSVIAAVDLTGGDAVAFVDYMHQIALLNMISEVETFKTIGLKEKAKLRQIFQHQEYTRGLFQSTVPRVGDNKIERLMLASILRDHGLITNDLFSKSALELIVWHSDDLSVREQKRIFHEINWEVFGDEAPVVKHQTSDLIQLSESLLASIRKRQIAPSTTQPAKQVFVKKHATAIQESGRKFQLRLISNQKASNPSGKRNHEIGAVITHLNALKSVMSDTERMMREVKSDKLVGFPIPQKRWQLYVDSFRVYADADLDIRQILVIAHGDRKLYIADANRNLFLSSIMRSMAGEPLPDHYLKVMYQRVVLTKQGGRVSVSWQSSNELAAWLCDAENGSQDLVRLLQRARSRQYVLEPEQLMVNLAALKRITESGAE